MKPSGRSKTVSRRVTVVNERGLHARAAARLVQLAERFDADVTVTKDAVTVPATSIMGLLMLAAAKGCRLELRARGRQAADAVAALAVLFADSFDEDP